MNIYQKKSLEKLRSFSGAVFVEVNIDSKKNMGYLQRVLKVPHFVSGLNFIN